MSGALEYKKKMEEHLKNVPSVYRKTDKDKAAFDMFEDRREYLQSYRRNTGIEDIWKSADRAYVPHQLSSKSKARKVLVSDDDLGWRSTPVSLTQDDEWQEDSVPPNPYVKIQTALGIIVDRNPTAVLTPGAKKYEKNTLLMKNLYERSWDIASSRASCLKPVVFNAAKYGIGIGRTFPLTIKKTVDDLVEFNPESNKKSKYKTVEQTYFNDVFRESLSPWQVWLDDATVVGNPWSGQDVIYYKDYDWQNFCEAFGHLGNYKFVKPQEKILTAEGKMEVFSPGAHENMEPKTQERVWIWESFRLDMLFIMTEDGVVLVNEPLPQSPKNKRLSIWYATWTLRDDKSPYGIGVYEAMRNDHKLFTKLRNMTMDQLVLSIYREFFYSGSDTMEGDGVMRTRPGRGRQVNDPKNMKWNEVPAPNKDAWLGMEYQEKKMDDATAISKNLTGEITGSTAFEISQARESSLKRLKTPLENITDGLERDAYISLGIIENLYSVPKVKLIGEDRYIEAFELEQYTKESGEELEQGTDYEYEYRELPMELERTQDGQVSSSKSESFFTLRPDDFPWEGVIRVQGQSIIANSELLERVTTVEMANIVVPLFQAPPELAKKAVVEIIKSYGKDPEDWMPDVPGWNDEMMAPAPLQPELFTDPAAAPGLETVTGDQPQGSEAGMVDAMARSMKFSGQ